MTPPLEPGYADRLLERMRVDTESDWAERLLAAITLATISLTGQQRRVLAAASVGMNITQTAEACGISYHSVRKHRRYAADRLGTQGVTQTVAEAIRKGFI